ncbi:MAG TPA: glycerol-3-phosphate 1-O-acyltransferase PlsY [Kiritimatiellia bacterium]|nr:glycerol-3-phosphate 1-O-acyltransferase PlsY [Kiritimatiellia bacterium]HMO99229.1 glycerol-3-phosphate 1-O-acyltransferase PlsY [Kiritimatiellia bacterium]HMP97483.1 glycerol-3-phosphate 1-O-acyltransferase PlsY [Kiritimatiellia bacterium]
MNAIDGVVLAAAYVLGAVPFGLLIGKARGIDIRRHGSGNIGATNVLRVLGKPLGILTFILDALKGFVPAFFFVGLAGTFGLPALEPVVLSVLCGAAAILGHNFPVFLGFRGGKGIATSAGVLIGIAPAAALTGVVAWVVVFFTLRYVSLASIIAAGAVAASGWWWYRDGTPVLPVVLTVLGGLAIVRHQENIKRLLAGTESRFKRKS